MGDVAQVKAVNTALAQLGKEPVSDLSDASLQGSIAATKLLRVIDDAYETVLARHGWACTLSYATLSPMATPPTDWVYGTAFQVPADYLRIWMIQNPFLMEMDNGLVPPDDWGLWSMLGLVYAEERWQVGTVDVDVGAQRIIKTQDVLTSLGICYVRRANWGALDVHLRDAIAFDMAARACRSITGDAALQDKLEKKAEAKVLMAISVDGTQEGGQPPLASSIPDLLRAWSR